MTHIDTGKAFLQGIVENLPHDERLTKDTARRGYGERGRSRIASETADDNGREFSQLCSGIGQEIAGDGVALIGGAEDDGKQAREIGWRGRVRLLHKFVDGVEFPDLEDHIGERGFEALILGAQR